MHPTYSDWMQTLNLRRPWMAVTALVVLAGALPAAAQDPYRQTVVVTAATTPVAVGDATRVVTVISREEILALPVFSVADALRQLAFVDVRARGPRGVQSDMAVRGASFGQMLVLVDGVRLNDPQSGHHNGDIPIPLEAVERIEVLQGAGSSLFGADAFGGTVNIITRRQDAAPRLTVHGGSFGTGGGAADASFGGSGVKQRVSGAFDRSNGFLYDRDYSTAIVHSRTAIGGTSGVSVSFLRKEFGANNFYGGNAPSREWTNQLLVAADHRLAAGAEWTLDVDGSYRTHGDRFLFDQLNPARSDSRHRTHTGLARAVASRTVSRGVLAAGLEGGHDWIRSSNLGDHELSRVSGFAEWRQSLGARAHLGAAVRGDRYSDFGTSWSPSLGAGWWVLQQVRLRGSVGRAFRVPTFTERYYSDPANLASPDVQPEQAWTGEAGADIALASGWLVQGTVFRRADRDVIDWLRPSPDDRWRTFNIRDVDTTGYEVAIRRRFGNHAFVHAGYSALTLDAPAVTQLSKYALDYAPQSLVASALVPLPWQLRAAPRLEYRRRTRSQGGEEYVLLDARVSRRLGPLVEVMVDGANLLDRSYSEVAGVAMPGPTVTVSLAIGR